jgi:anti-sigma factor RsiW
MNHREASLLLDQFLDGALSADARWAVAAHLDDCAICRTQVAKQARLRGVVRQHLSTLDAPQGLRDRIRAALAAEAAGPEPEPAARFAPTVVALRFAAILIPALLGLWLLVHVTTPFAGAPSHLQRELAATHALFAHDETLLDVTGDADAIASWFHDTASLRVETPDLSGFTLVGGRLVTLDGEAAAQVVYEREPDDVYLSLLPIVSTQDQDERERVFGGGEEVRSHEGTTSVLTRLADGTRVALVSTLPGEELQQLAGELAST